MPFDISEHLEPVTSVSSIIETGAFKIKEKYKRGRQKERTVNSSSSSSLEFSSEIITGLATIVQCGFFNPTPRIFYLQIVKIDRDNLKTTFESRKSRHGLIQIPFFLVHCPGNTSQLTNSQRNLTLKANLDDSIFKSFL